MSSKVFFYTPGDGRRTANAFWIDKHLAIIPKVEQACRANGLDPVWLHTKDIAVRSGFHAAEVGKNLLSHQISQGDVLMPLTTGWNWPAHCGIPVTMVQDEIESGTLMLIHACNMEATAPGYVGQRANVLRSEIMELPYAALVVVDQSDAGWREFETDLGKVLVGEYEDETPQTPVEITDEHRKTAQEAIKWIRSTGGVAILINASSMTMDQGWPNLHLFFKLGLNPIFMGSNEFATEMAKIQESDVDWVYGWLRHHGINIRYEEGGLNDAEIRAAIRMYLTKLNLWAQGALAFGTQGQMDTTMSDVATDLSESLMSSTVSPGKKIPVDDVTEADCEALFTQVLMTAINWVKFGKRIANGFHDVRHYDLEQDVLILLNSGAHTLDVMCDQPGDYSDIWLVSQNRDVYFLNGGTCVYGNIRPYSGASMFRAHGKGAGYRMQATSIDFLPLTWEERLSSFGNLDQWPMGKTKVIQGDQDITLAVTKRWIPNHSQTCNTAIIPEMAAACELLGIKFHCFAMAA